MIDIKFRVWDKVNKSYLGYTVGAMNTLTNSYSDDSLEFEQYIGFLDKNGKEIYVGDTIKWVYFDNTYINKIDSLQDFFAIFYSKDYDENKFDIDECEVAENKL